jgi:hypothetical protein
MRRPRRLADRLDKHRIPIVCQHHVGRRRQSLRIGRDDGGDALVSVGDDGALSASVDEDHRERRCGSGNTLTSGAVHRLARERRQHEVAVGVGAHRPGERGAAAEAGNGDGGIGGAAPVDDKKPFRRRLAVGRREILDVKNLIDHADAGAQDAQRARFRWTPAAIGVLNPRHVRRDLSLRWRQPSTSAPFSTNALMR